MAATKAKNEAAVTPFVACLASAYQTVLAVAQPQPPAHWQLGPQPQWLPQEQLSTLVFAQSQDAFSHLHGLWFDFSIVISCFEAGSTACLHTQDAAGTTPLQ